MERPLQASLVILSFNGLNHLRELLPSIEKQTLVPELIIIDSESNDGTCEYLNSVGLSFVSVLKNTFDHGGTRNLGLSLASHDYVVFLTQDVILDNDDSLERLIAPLISNPDVVMSFGRQLPKKDATVISEFARINNYPDVSKIKSIEDAAVLGIKTPWISNSYSAYRKSKLIELGQFPSKLIMCEDVFAGAKAILAGYKIAYVAEARAFHSHNYTITEELKRYFDIGHFYNSESWILDSFSKAEAEGISFIKKEIAYLMNKKRFALLPEFLVRTIVKYVGYKLGKYSRLIPHKLKFRISMHSYYWKQKN